MSDISISRHSQTGSYPFSGTWDLGCSKLGSDWRGGQPTTGGCTKLLYVKILPSAGGHALAGFILSQIGIFVKYFVTSQYSADCGSCESAMGKQ